MTANSINPMQIIVHAENDNEEHDETDTFLSTNYPTPAVNASAVVPKMSEEKSKRSKQNRASEISTFNQYLTTVAHACVLLFVILIIYFCFSGDFVFFTWHPILLSLGWMFLMSEAILAINKDNLFTGTLPKKVRVRLHWIFLTASVVLTFSGFTVVFINKDNHNKEHFKTWHGLCGLIGIISSLPTCLDGIAALYHGDIRLRQYISPRINKFIHITSGVTTFTFGGIALVLSVYTNWFAKNSNNNVIAFSLGLVLTVYPVLWTLIKPVTTCVQHLKKFMKLE